MKINLFFAFLLFINISISQEIHTKLVSKTSLNADHFIGVDELDNIYYLEDNVLNKKTSREIFTYSNVNLGKLNSVNINNPFKVILLYKDYNSIIVLDNKLNELTQTITFPNNNISSVSYASENNLWIYSKDNNKLQLFDYQNKIIHLITQPLGFYHDGFMADNLSSNNENVWLFNKNGVLQFNQYTSFINFYDIENIEKIFPFKKGVIYIQNDHLSFFENETINPIALDSSIGEKEVFFNKGSFYIFNNNTLYHYKILY